MNLDPDNWGRGIGRVLLHRTAEVIGRRSGNRAGQNDRKPWSSPAQIRNLESEFLVGSPTRSGDSSKLSALIGKPHLSASVRWTSFTGWGTPTALIDGGMPLRDDTSGTDAWFGSRPYGS
jgi:hypothetical protein